MENGWNGLPFRPIPEFYKSRFGGKVYKIPVATADACPNRLGLKGMKTCSFCDVWGSAARAEALDLELSAQVSKYTDSIGKRFHASQFLVYFQAYTSTFSALPKIREQFEFVLKDPRIRGVIIGTRPDCISQGLLDLWEEFSSRCFVAVELGVQSFDDDELDFLRRGHKNSDSLKAIERISKRKNIDLGIHLMFGLPKDSHQTMRETALLCNELPISNVKLHNLHVLKNTHLETLHQQGLFQPVEREEYAELVRNFLEPLHPRIFIQRLAAFSSRFDELIAPQWTSDKMGTHQFIIERLRQRQSFQAKSYVAKTPEESILRDQLLLQSKAAEKNLCLGPAQ